MSTLFDLKRRALTSQVYFIVYSAILALVGQGPLLYVLFFLFIILTIYLQSRRGRSPLGTAKTKPDEILSGKKLYEERSARELQMRDEKLLLEIQEQSKATMTLTMASFAGLIYFFLLWRHIYDIEAFLIPYVGIEKLALFLAFLIYFEGFFVISTGLQYYAMKRIGKMPFFNMPTAFTITDKGIVMKGFIGQTGIPFPLPDNVKVTYNTKRGFAEIIKEDAKSVIHIRFYTRNPKKLAEILERYGIRGSSSQE